MIRTSDDFLARVHSLFRPVLIWTMRGFLRRVRRLIDHGQGHAFMIFHVTRFGRIEIETVYATDPEPADWQVRLAQCRSHLSRLIEDLGTSSALRCHPVGRAHVLARSLSA